MREPLVFVTGNISKFKLTKRYLHYPIIHQKIDLTEIQSLDPRDVVADKARKAYQYLKKPVLVEDTSLVFGVLGKLPGTYIKWFYEELGNDRLCHMLAGYDDRSAVASVCFGYFAGRGDVLFFEGEMRGSIAQKPRGNGFGWTPIFIPEDHDKTWGELSPTEQDKTAMRRIALEKLNVYLERVS